MAKQTKVITRRKKFIEVEIPLTNQKIELVGNSVEDVEGRTIKLDMTRQLKGKSVEVVVKIVNEDGKAVAYPRKIRLMPYFIRRIIRKRISYVEDSFEVPSQESMLKIKPFLITRKRVSRVVRNTLRNKAKNWLEDYVAERSDSEIFSEILGNRMQRPLSLVLKKTYPLSLCEIRVLEIKRPLEADEVPEIKEVKKVEKVEVEEELDQLKEIEEEKLKKAQEDIKKTQAEAVEKEKKVEEEVKEEVEDLKKVKEKSATPESNDADVKSNLMKDKGGESKSGKTLESVSEKKVGDVKKEGKKK